MLGQVNFISDAQILNGSKLKKKIENGIFRYLNPWERARFALFYFERQCLEAMACETLQQKTTHLGRENSKLQDP